MNLYFNLREGLAITNFSANKTTTSPNPSSGGELFCTSWFGLVCGFYFCAYYKFFSQ